MPTHSFFRASESLRSSLRTPLGKLVPDSKVTASMLEKMVFGINKEQKVVFATVGDRTTERLLEYGLRPNLQVIDSIEKRMKRSSIRWEGDPGSLLVTENRAGGIDSRALDALDHCFRMLESEPGKSVRVLVKGEEDLLVLPIVAFCPQISLVMYGQPNEGLVVVDSAKSRSECTGYLEEMGIISPSRK